MINISNIAILLATYNGATYIGEQIDSLLAQTYADWQLYVHDDGSCDTTITIIKEYAAKDNRIHLLDYPSQGGACQNFLSLLQQVDAPYYMFCDQDDVWLPDKIEKEMQLMQQCELKNPHTPVVVHSDLQVVDASKQTICPSFWQYENIVPERYNSWDSYARGCLTTGCTMLFNSKAKEVTLPVSSHTLMHDEWVTLCTIAHEGVVFPYHQPTVLYRQHGDNTLGAQDAVHRHSMKYLCSHIGLMIRGNIAHYKQMNIIRPISVFTYLKHKFL